MGWGSEKFFAGVSICEKTIDCSVFSYTVLAVRV